MSKKYFFRSKEVGSVEFFFDADLRRWALGVESTVSRTSSSALAFSFQVALGPLTAGFSR